MASKNHVKIVTRHVWQYFKEQLNAYQLSVSGKEIYKHRKELLRQCEAIAWSLLCAFPYRHIELNQSAYGDLGTH